MSKIFKTNDDTNQGESKDEMHPLKFSWNTSTSDNTTTGRIQGDNADYALISNLYINATTVNFLTITEKLLNIKSGATIILGSKDRAGACLFYEVSADAVLNSSTITLAVTYKDSGDTGVVFDNTEGMYIDIGSTSSGGGGGGITLATPYVFDIDTVDSDPTAGKLKFDNVVYASVTFIYIDDFNNNGLDISNLISNIRANDIIYVQQGDDATKSVLFNVSGTPVDGSGYWKIPVTHNTSGSGGNIADASNIGLVFHRGVAPTRTIAFFSLTSGANISTDCNESTNFKLTLDDDGTLDNPANMVDGETYEWWVTQGVTGGTLAYGSAFEWSGGSAPIASTTTGALDKIVATSDGTKLIANISKTHS